MIVEERVGSVIFYLDPALRAELRPGQLRGERADTVAKWTDAKHGSMYALPESRVEKFGASLGVDKADWEPAGRYRLYCVKASTHPTEKTLARSGNPAMR